MSKDQSKPAMAFIVAFLKDNPTATYAVVKAEAESRGLVVYPIMFGRAQAMLGLVEVAPRGTGKRRRAGREQAAETTLPPTVDPSSLAGLVTTIRQSEEQRIRYRGALEHVSAILRQALA